MSVHERRKERCLNDQGALLEARGLQKHYAGVAVVQNVSFRLRAGQVLGLLGPNGAGKSTTLRMLTGELAPSAGQIRICGHDLLEQPRRAKSHLGYLPENPPLHRELTVDEYLRFCSALRGVRRVARGAAVERARRRCGLFDRGRRCIGQLSKGYQQRVGIAQAIVHEPSVVVLDEPTVGLDPIQVREIRLLVRELGEERAVLVSSHILAEVQASCTHLQILHQGRLVFAASLEQLEARAGTGALITRLGKAPPEPALAAVSGVRGVETLQRGRFRLSCVDPEDTARALLAAATANDWDLLELHPDRRTLEQIFVELTVREGSAS
jgi:ABC-2 type transport system ATP-binding protein